MKLNKASQKIDNNICKALTIACESALHEVSGFSWLTHRANYTNFPASLVITCVFETEAEIEEMKRQEKDDLLRNAILKQLVKVGVVLKKAKQQIHFDSEEACLQHDQGKWPQRLALPTVKQKPNEARRLH
jgi:hypothetical protein